MIVPAGILPAPFWYFFFRFLCIHENLLCAVPAVFASMRHLKPCQCKGLAALQDCFLILHIMHVPSRLIHPFQIAFQRLKSLRDHVIDALTCLHRRLDFIDIGVFLLRQLIDDRIPVPDRHIFARKPRITSHIRPGQENAVNLGTFFRCKQLMIVKYVRQVAADTLTAHRPHRPFPAVPDTGISIVSAPGVNNYKHNCKYNAACQPGRNGSHSLQHQTPAKHSGK